MCRFPPCATLAAPWGIALQSHLGCAVVSGARMFAAVPLGAVDRGMGPSWKPFLSIGIDEPRHDLVTNLLVYNRWSISMWYGYVVLILCGVSTQTQIFCKSSKTPTVPLSHQSPIKATCDLFNVRKINYIKFATAFSPCSSFVFLSPFPVTVNSQVTLWLNILQEKVDEGRYILLIDCIVCLAGLNSNNDYKWLEQSV